LILLAVFLAPRFILTRHFWTPEQRREFWTKSLKFKRDVHFSALAEAFEKRAISLPVAIDRLSQLSLPPLFDFGYMHQLRLARVHSVFLPMGGSVRLEMRARALTALDRMLTHRLDSMSEPQLVEQLFLRRLPFSNKSPSEMRETLRQWVRMSKEVDGNSSLYLHAPFLVQYMSKDERPEMR